MDSGDCVPVAWANQRRLLTYHLGIEEQYPLLHDVVNLYKTQNPNFDPNGFPGTNGPGSTSDHGMNLYRTLDGLRLNGSPDGSTLLAFASVDPQNLEEVHRAIAIFGSIWISFKVFDATRQQWKLKQPFSVPDNQVSHELHSVVVGGYVPNMTCVTWGTLNQFVDNYWTSGNVTEAYVSVWPEHIGKEGFMTGVDLEALAQEYEKIHGRPIQLPEMDYSNLYMITDPHPGSNPALSMQVNIAFKENYYNRGASSSVTIDSAFGNSTDRIKGIWQMDTNKDLYLFFTPNNSKSIELWGASSDSDWKTFMPGVSTITFVQGDLANGYLRIDNGDIYFIKTRGTPSNTVEIQKLLRGKYTVQPAISVTKIPVAAADGIWTVYNGDVFFIGKPHSPNPNDPINLTVLTASTDYQQSRQYPTAFGAALFDQGVWDIGANGDLYFIRTINSQTGQVEVNICLANSYYCGTHFFISWFPISALKTGQLAIA
jgi:hypothetical protein